MKNIISVLKYLPLALVALFVSCEKDEDEGEIVEIVESLPQDGMEAGHGYVDLGLPSGLKWATNNVGGVYKFRDSNGFILKDENGKPKQEERADMHGYYFAWGEVTSADSLVNSYSTSWKGGKNTYYLSLLEDKRPKEQYLWSYYKYGPESNQILKYNQREECGKIDNRTELDSYDDAAAMNWGGKWRMPTRDELNELRENCYWVYYYNYNGTHRIGYVIFRAKSPEDKGVIVGRGQQKNPAYSLRDPHIFIRFSGFRRGKTDYNLGEEGTIWSSSLNGPISTAAHCIIMKPRSCIVTNCDRFTGRPVRAVFK